MRRSTESKGRRAYAFFRRLPVGGELRYALHQARSAATWINAAGKFTIREMEGNKVLVKLADNPFTKRARIYMGPTDWSNYTVEADFRASKSAGNSAMPELLRSATT